MSTARSADDPITQQVIKNGLRSVANEMVLMILRTAHSVTLREGMDCSTALFDRAGNSIAQGVTLAVHLGAMPDALACLRAKFQGDIHPGDVFIVNDPDEGGMHLPDVFAFVPVFAGDALIGFTGTVTHHKDVGGRVPGSIAADSTDIFQEGLQIPAVKLYEQGQLCSAVVDIIRKNSRFPNTVVGDLNAQLAACRFGAQGLLSFATKYGPDVLQQYLDRILDGTERLVRAAIAEMPDGVYRFVDHIDDDGFGSGPVALSVTVTIDGDRLVADFDGTSPQVRASLNATESVTKAVVYTVVQCCIDAPDTAMDNSGAHRPIEVRVPAGTILNPHRPAARGSRGLTIYRLLDAVFGAFHGALPDRVPAAGDGGIDMMQFVGTDASGRLHLFYEGLTAGWGGRPDADGIDGTSNMLANIANTPIEILEATAPVVVEESGFAPDTGGPGRFRGCLALRRRYRVLFDTGAVQIRSDRRRFPPYGLNGGHPGAPSMSVFDPDGTAEVLPAMLKHRPLRRGEVVVHATAGGGGFGDPFERDPQRVLEDVLDGKVTEAHAREAYGVEVDVVAGTARRIAARADS